MSLFSQIHPAFPVFAACAAVLVLKMIVVGHYTALIRIRKKAFLNPEDAQQFAGRGDFESAEDPEVERGLRAHRNDLESTLPFLSLGLVYLWMGASPGLAKALFISFTVLRCAFSVFYLRALQPWRSLSFTLAELCVIVMAVQILYWAITG